MSSRLHQYGLHLKFAGIVGGVLFVCLAGTLLFDTLTQAALLNRQTREHARRTAAELARSLAGPIADGDVDAVTDRLSFTLEREEVAFAYAFDAQGCILSDGSPDSPAEGYVFKDSLSLARARSDVPTEATLLGLHSFTHPVVVDSQRVGGVRIDVTTGANGGAFVQQRENTFLFGGIVALLGLLVALLFAHRLNRPVRALRDAIDAVARGEFDRQVSLHRKDAVGSLAHAFNKMARVLKRWRLELIRAKNHTENVIKSMLDTLILVSPGGRIRTVNGATCSLLSYLPEELIGQPIQQIIPEFPFERFAAGQHGGGFVHNLEIFYMAKGGHLIPMSFSASPMWNEEGGLVGIVCVAQDITERKRFESELIDAKETAEEMSRLKSSFLANMSHEIRTPLTAIIGYSQILSDEVPEEQREFTSMIETGGKRLLETLNSVLDLARLEAEELELVPEAFDAAEEVQEGVRLFVPAAEEKGLRLDVTVSSPSIHVRLDRISFGRILSNLVNNAIKFTHRGRILVTLESDAQQITLKVKDTGIGMNPEFLPFVFDEFKQESTGESRSFEGTGLGLSITKKLVDLYDGTIAVYSKRGVGTTFVVRLPRNWADVVAELPPATVGGDGYAGRAAAAPAVVAQPQRPRPSGKPRVLVVEDNAETQRLLRHLLGKDYEPALFSREKEALDAARRTPFDLVLMDINLGNEQRTGLEVMQELRTYAAYEKTPIIAMTAYALPGDEERFVEAGFTDYIAKPFSREKLFGLLHSVQEMIAAR